MTIRQHIISETIQSFSTRIPSCRDYHHKITRIHFFGLLNKIIEYLFCAITTSSSGVTDPNHQIYDDGNNGTNYVDPTDPRVPTTDALLPIVFDGVTVTDYAAETEPDREIN